MFGIMVAGKRVCDKFAEDEMAVYAAQVSLFIILSMVPFTMLLLTAVQAIPSISNARFMESIVGLVPVDYKSLAFRLVNDLSLKSPVTMISVTAIMALRSTDRGVFSVARGSNRVSGYGEKRWYMTNRLVCSGYVIVFTLVCIPSLGLLVFGNMIQEFMMNRFPVITNVTTHTTSLRALWAMMILIIFLLGIYTFVPDKRLKLRDQPPRTAFSTAGWMAFSFAFSLYFSHIGGKNYSYMYGSLTAIMLLFLWLYLCIYTLFFGAEINYFWKELFPGEAAEQPEHACLLDKGQAAFVSLMKWSGGWSWHRRRHADNPGCPGRTGGLARLPICGTRLGDRSTVS